jgi:outer membrane protein
MKTRTLQAALALCASALLAQPMVAAASQGDWLVRSGLGYVAPIDDNLKNVGGQGSHIQVQDGMSLTIEVAYMLTDHWGVELLAAWPFAHDVKIDGLGTVAEVEHLPPTLSVQYYFVSEGQVRPYIGAGLNYTVFTREREVGALRDGVRLELDDSWGLALQAGIDFGVHENWFGNVGVRYIDIESDLSLNGSKVGTVKIDPFVYQFQFGYRFGR